MQSDTQSTDLPPSPEQQEKVRAEASWIELLRREIGRVIVGQKYLVDRLIVGLLANGHVLLEGIGQDTRGQDACPMHESRLPAHPIHTRLAAIGYYGNIRV